MLKFRSNYSHALIGLSALFLVGCQSTAVQQTDQKLDEMYVDNLFREIPIETMDEIFAVSPAMADYTRRKLTPVKDPYKRGNRIVKDLFSRTDLNLIYSSNANLTAAETFDQGVANCLSLTIMTYVLAHEAGLATEFRDVLIDEYWTNEGKRVFLNGHVNLRILGELHNPTTITISQRVLTVDFMPIYGSKRPPSSRLSKEQLVALFYNNKGAEAMATEQHDLAYNYFRKALDLSPRETSVMNNLALLYRRIGFYERAEELYHHAIAINSMSLNLHENLAYLYKTTDREAEGEKILNQLNKKRQSNPFYHQMLGEQAYLRGEYKESLRHYRKANKLAKHNHEVMFGMARSYFELGDYASAARYMNRAYQYGNGNDLKDLYRGKMAALSNVTARL